VDIRGINNTIPEISHYYYMKVSMFISLQNLPLFKKKTGEIMV
jgi:hypothetical protein